MLCLLSFQEFHVIHSSISLLFYASVFILCDAIPVHRPHSMYGLCRSVITWAGLEQWFSPFSSVDQQLENSLEMQAHGLHPNLEHHDLRRQSPRNCILRLSRCFLGMLIFETHLFRAGNANFFHKDPNNKYFGFAHHTVSVTATQLCNSSKKQPQRIYKQVSMDVFQ